MRETETKVLPVLEMSCAVCAGNVESTVQALSGVEKASEFRCWYIDGNL